MATTVQTGFRLVEVSGGPRERGRQHGEACREQVRGYADALLTVLAGEAALRALDERDHGAGASRAGRNGDTGRAGDGRTEAGDNGRTARAHGRRDSGATRLTAEELYGRAMTFLPFFEDFAPHLVEEIRGIAEGADVPFAAALLVNVRAEVAGVRAGVVSGAVEGCTSFAVGPGATVGGAVLVGQNQDQSPEMEGFGVVLKVRPDEGPPALMATFGGLVGYPGVNGDGVAFAQNALANGVWRHALPHYPLKRALLEQSSVDGCVAEIGRARLASCGNMMMGDATGRLLDVEATPDGYATVEAEEGVLVHTNHFRSERYAPEEKLLQNLPDSAARLARMTALLEAERGRITLEAIKSALRDHDGGEAAICRHEPGRPMKTIASIIAEPQHGRLHVSRGNPCVNEYVTYAL